MFERYDLTHTTDDKTFNKAMPPLQKRIGELQREYRDRKIPVIIVVEGWNASGITAVISELIRSLDPRGYRVSSIGRPNDEERARQMLWRFWIKTPAKGRIAIFARSWYSRSLAEEATGILWENSLAAPLTAIRHFERQLADDGTVILKFFLHISKDEQKERLRERERSPLTSWVITNRDWSFHRHYHAYLPIIERFIEETDAGYAPWTIVEATDKNYAALKVFSSIISGLEARLTAPIQKPLSLPKPGNSKPSGLGNLDLSVSLSKSDYEEKLRKYQEKICESQHMLYRRKIPLIIVYEGWDAAGKGGNIIRLTQTLNPKAYSVVPVSRPNDAEREHHYLWRFYRQFPKAGHITIFDRSWYGRVLVERVEEFCPREAWMRAYDEIVQMEEMYTENGGLLVKFWLEIDKAEQLKRFTQREKDPAKEWKMTEEDWRNREKWDLYREAVDEMLVRTSTPSAPWTVIESNDKYYARIKALSHVVTYIEDSL